MQCRYIHHGNGSEEQYDHQRDPNEWTNVAGDATLASVRSAVAKFMPEINAKELANAKGGGEG